jgi:protein TonB
MPTEAQPLVVQYIQKVVVPQVINGTIKDFPSGNSTVNPPSLLPVYRRPPPGSPVPSRRIQLSGAVQETGLLSQVPPAYPPLARQARIQGDVILQSNVSKDGTVEDLQVVSGHPLLVQAALDAVRQWRYQPTELNGEPVEVDTTTTVRFRFSE